MYFRRPAALAMRDVAFLAAFMVYAAAGIDPRLIFHWQGPVFTTIPGFLDEFLKYPGGPADYLQSLVAQAYAFRWWGAVAMTAQLAAVLLLTQRYLSDLTGVAAARYAIALLLVYHFGFYYDRTPIVLALLAGLVFAIGFVRLSHRLNSEWMLAGASVAMLVAVYYLAGMSLVFFAPAAAIVLVARRRNPPLWILPLVLGAALPVAVETLGLVPAPMSAREWFVNSDVHREIVYGGLYTILAAAALWRRPFSIIRGRVPEAIPAVALLLSLVCVAAASYHVNARDRRLTSLDYEVWRENWLAVIEAGRDLPAGDFSSLTRYEINLALHETNRLGDEMFRFPQKSPMLLTLRADPFLPYMIRVTDLCLRLGRLNEAERFGSEAMLLSQRDPRVFRQMVNVNLVKGRTAAARKFLTVLSYDAASGAWARTRLRELDRDPELTGDREVQLLRRRMLRTDDVIPVWQRPDNPSADLDRLLLDQLEQDPGNRMAFEFLMGDYLLARDMLAVHALMPRIANMTGPAYLDSNGRRRTPRLYQEAMAIYANATGEAVRMNGLEVQPETEERFETFKKTVRQYVTRESAMQSVWNDFRDSYFFYFTFGPGDYR